MRPLRKLQQVILKVAKVTNMKRLTLKQMKKAALVWSRTGLFQTRPAPFPGTTPTRVGIELTLQDGEKISYFGKPSRAIGQKFTRLIRQRTDITNIFACEQDRKSFLYVTNGTIRNVFADNRMYFNRWDSMLYNFYNPWPIRAEEAFTWMQFSYWRKKVAGHYVYSPIAVLKKLEHIAPFRAWCTGQAETEWVRREAEAARRTINTAPVNPRAVASTQGRIRFVTPADVAPDPTPAPANVDWFGEAVAQRRQQAEADMEQVLNEIRGTEQ